MNTIKSILERKKVQDLSLLPRKKGLELLPKQRPLNETWEVADEFGKYCGLPTPYVLRLFKMFGQNKVLSIRSWLADCPYDPERGGKISLAMWKLKELANYEAKKGA